VTDVTDSKRSLPSWLPLVGGLLAAVVGMLLIWALFIKADEDAANDGPEVVSAAQLSNEADQLERPIYWVGERDGARYELSESESGRVYVRYLTGDAEAGVKSTDYVTVGTYPVDDGVAALKRAAKAKPGAELARSDDGATMLINPQTPGSIHLAYPDSKWQIELYSPDVEEGLRLVKDGQVKPVP
jgi:hypothetical protein